MFFFLKIIYAVLVLNQVIYEPNFLSLKLWQMLFIRKNYNKEIKRYGFQKFILVLETFILNDIIKKGVLCSISIKLWKYIAHKLKIIQFEIQISIHIFRFDGK